MEEVEVEVVAARREGASLMSGSAPGSPLMSLTGSSSEEAGGENTVQADKVGQPTLWTVS